MTDNSFEGPFYIISEHNPNLVLDVEGASTAQGAKLIVWTFHGGANQQFTIDDHGSIKNVNSGLVLDVCDGPHKGNHIIQWGCN